MPWCPYPICSQSWQQVNQSSAVSIEAVNAGSLVVWRSITLYSSQVPVCQKLTLTFISPFIFHPIFVLLFSAKLLMSHPCSVCASPSPCPSPERAWSRSLRTCMLLHPKVKLRNQWFSGPIFHDSLAAFSADDYSLLPEMLLSRGFQVISLSCFSSYFIDFAPSVAFSFILSSGPLLFSSTHPVEWL